MPLRRKPGEGAPLQLDSKSVAAAGAVMLAADDKSFRSQMHRVFPEAPDAFLFTAYSAVPVADSVRGFYAAAGDPTPAINFINANRDASRHPGSEKYTTRVDYESKRLEAFLDGCNKVCIVDQFVYTGRTIKLASEIIGTAGVEVVCLMKGNWYQDTWNSDIDLVDVTSAFQKEMFVVGQDAYNAGS